MSNDFRGNRINYTEGDGIRIPIHQSPPVSWWRQPIRNCDLAFGFAIFLVAEIVRWLA